MALDARVVFPISLILVACGASDQGRGLEDETSTAGTVLQDGSASARFRLRTTYEGAPVSESTTRVTFELTRDTGGSEATASLDIRLVSGNESVSTAIASLPPGNTNPNPVDLAWTNWCPDAPCDVSADVEIELLPTVGQPNPAVQVSRLTARAEITYESQNPERPGILEVALTPVTPP